MEDVGRGGPPRTLRTSNTRVPSRHLPLSYPLSSGVRVLMFNGEAENCVPWSGEFPTGLPLGPFPYAMDTPSHSH